VDPVLLDVKEFWTALRETRCNAMLSTYWADPLTHTSGLLVLCIGYWYII